VPKQPKTELALTHGLVLIHKTIQLKEPPIHLLTNHKDIIIPIPNVTNTIKTETNIFSLIINIDTKVKDIIFE